MVTRRVAIGRMERSLWSKSACLTPKPSFPSCWNVSIKQGQPILVTNCGKPVAELTPVRHPPQKKTTREEAFARIAEFWKEEPVVTQGEIRQMLNEGRNGSDSNLCRLNQIA